MTDETYTVVLTGDSAELDASLQQASASAKESAAEISAAFDASGADVAASSAAMADGAKAGMADLESDMAAAGTAAGNAVSDGVKDSADDLKSDMETTGEDAGAALGAGVKDGSSDLESELTNAGLLAGQGARDGVKEGADGVEDDLGKAGQDGGKALSDGVESGTSGVKNMLGNLGVPSALLNGWAAAGLGIAGAGAVAVHSATQFQSAMTELVTGAGESEKNIGLVSSGILGMAGQVGQSADALAKGMYLIESAGYHGAAGLSVLKASAQGAAVGNADMATVANAVTTALTDYHLSASQAANVTSALVETVASGKTNMDALAGSLGKVMPQASALGVSFQDVTGAMATMTNAGLSARLASQHLSNTLLAMSAPSTTATSAMASVGLSSQQVKNALDGPGGLSAAMQLIETAVGKTFPAGSVQAVTAFKNILGGATGYSTALMLTGKSSDEFSQNVKNIGERLQGTSTQVQGFSKVQGDLKFQLDAAKASVDAMGIQVGQALIPVLTDLMKILASTVLPVVEQLAKVFLSVTKAILECKPALIAIAVVAGGMAAKAILGLATSMTESLGKAAYNLANTIATTLIPGFEGFDAAAEESATTAEATGEASAAAFGPIGLAIEGVALVALLLVTHWKQVKAALLDIWDAIKGAAITVWDFIKDHIKDVVEALVAIVAGPFGIIADLIYNNWDTIKSFTIGVWDDIVNFFTSIPSRVMGALSALASDVENIAKTAWNDFLNTVESVTGDVISFVTSIPGKILSALGDLGSLLLSAGEDLIKGLINGVKSMVGDAIGAVKNVASSMVHSVTSFLGIGSPSKVFAGFGQNIVEGLAQGIEQNGHLAVSATKALAQQVSSVPFNTPQVSPAAVAAAGGASGTLGATGPLVGGAQVGNQITQNLTVTQAAGPNDIAYAMSLGMKKVML